MSAPSNRVAPWEDLILRVIAIYKLLHGFFFTAVGVGFLRLRHHDVVDLLNKYVVPWINDNIVPYVQEKQFGDKMGDWLIQKASLIIPHLTVLAWVAFFYAALFFAEGVGLFMRKIWAEYLVVIVTGSLLPFEIYEIFHKETWWKLVAFACNLLIVFYLIHRIKLDARRRQQARDNLTPPPPASKEDTAVVTDVRR